MKEINKTLEAKKDININSRRGQPSNRHTHVNKYLKLQYMVIGEHLKHENKFLEIEQYMVITEHSKHESKLFWNQVVYGHWWTLGACTLAIKVLMPLIWVK